MTQKQRTFNYHWGSGYIAEEARVQGRYHSPALQLLRYTDGEAAGQVSLRFCHYSHGGMFRRSPLLMSSEEIEMMREALRQTPELRDMLLRLAED